MKIVDAQEYISTMRELTKEGKEVSLLITGNSMSPFLIHQRDVIYFSAPDRELRVGDMVFFQRDNGQFVMHRIWKVKKDGYYIVGDAQTAIEGPIRCDQIFARINAVQRKGKVIREGNFWWFFFEKIWIRLVPFRPVLVRLYSACSNVVKGR